MKNFNYINREHVNPIDLNVLGRTYDTLEQGHQAAIKATSDLKTMVASLDLNEAEDKFRQQFIGEINQTVEENTNHGNAYGALDNIIAKAGDIKSNPGMIGRLQAQKDYKAYHSQLDQSNDIPEAMKDMFREENKYHYADKVDEKTGTIIGGTKWEPNTRPVATVDRFKLMSNALSIAARESGNSSDIQFLDINGKPTRDASKSATGEMYMQTNGSWERLSESKIRAAIESATNSTPGARESFEQDYRFATWKHLKDDAANGDKPSIVEGVTDKHGNMLDYKTFVDKQVTPFVKAASYNNYRNDVQMGTALQTRRAQQAAAATAQNQPPVNPLKELMSANNVGKLEVDVDNYSTSVGNKNAANKSALDIIKKYTPQFANKIGSVSDFIQLQKASGFGHVGGNIYQPEQKSFGPGMAVTRYIKDLESKGTRLSVEDKHALINAVKGYHSYNTEQKKIEGSVSPEDRKALRFGNSVATGEYTAGKSRWDDAIVSNNNKIWAKNDKVDIALSPNIVKNLVKQFGVAHINELGLNTTTDDDGKLVVSFTGNDRNMLPAFMSNLKKADDETGMSWAALGNALTKRTYSDYVITAHPKKGVSGKMGYTELGTRGAMDIMASAYDNGMEKAVTIQKRAGVQKGIMSIEGTGKNNFRQIEIDAVYNNGGMKPADFSLQSKRAEEDVNNMFASGDFNAGLLYVADDANNFTKSAEANEMGALVSYMYQKHPNNITRNAIIPTGVADTRKGANVPLKGYVLNFTVPQNAEGDLLKNYKGKTIKLMYGGGLKESLSSDPSLATSVVVTNIFNTSKATNTPAVTTPYHNALGSTDVTFDKGKPSINFLGSSIPVNNDKIALEYMKNIYTLDDLKAAAKNGMISDANMFQQGVGTVINNISLITGKDPVIVQTAIYNYLNQ